MKIRGLAPALAFIVCTHTTFAFEGIMTYSASDGGYAFGSSGWTFTPLDNISVTMLGCFDYVLANQSPISVGLWASDGTLLASDVVNSGSPLLNQSRYESVSPVNLNAGMTYYLAAYSTDGQIVLVAAEPSNGGVVNTSSHIQLGQAVYNPSGFAFPNNFTGSAGSAFLTANFQYVVPEPSSTMLSIAGAAFACRKRRSKL
jgi:hypothetical protein